MSTVVRVYYRIYKNLNTWSRFPKKVVIHAKRQANSYYDALDAKMCITVIYNAKEKTGLLTNLIAKNLHLSHKNLKMIHLKVLMNFRIFNMLELVISQVFSKQHRKKMDKYMQLNKLKRPK